LKDKFGEHAPPEVEAYGNGILSYSYLFKELRFIVEFDRLKEPLLFKANSDETAVAAFGFLSYPMSKDVVISKWVELQREIMGDKAPTEEELKNLASLIQIFRYKNENNIIIGLRSMSENDEIILAKIPHKKTLLKTIEYVSKEVKTKKPDMLENTDRIAIPKFNFNVKHLFTEVMNKLFLNKGWAGWYIDEAQQWTRFTMNEKGVTLASEARIHFRGGRSNYRRLIFDKPFLIYMKQKGAKYPYFAMWVDNAELMVKYEQ
jgi:hypothetical protein